LILFGKIDMKLKYFVGILFIFVILLSFLPKISGNLNDVKFYSSIDTSKVIPVKGIISEISDNLYKFIDKDGNEGKLFAPNITNNEGIFYLKYDEKKDYFTLTKFENNTFFITFPFIPGLEEKSRIILYHVPVAWVSVLAFLISMFYGIRYLKSEKNEFDIRSVNSASLGFLFCILATVTGSIWARFNWGSFWNWDPRETSIFILLLIYAAYFALRSAIEVEEKKAKLSAVYSIIAFVTVPFFIFILPRITSGLHPGSADDVASPGGGPVIKSGMSFEMRIVFFLSLIAFTLLFFWIFILRNRVTELERKKI